MPDDQPLIRVLLERIVDLETTVADIAAYHKPTGYHEAAERIEKRAREQRMFDRTGMTPDEIVDRIVGEAKKCQTQIAEDLCSNPNAIEPAFQSSYNPSNVEGMCSPHVFAVHEGKMLCRKCGWNPNAPQTCQTPNAKKSKQSSGDPS